MAAVLSLIIIALCAQLTRSWVSVGTRNRHSELFVYGFAAAGTLYAIQFFTNGGL